MIRTELRNTLTDALFSLERLFSRSFMCAQSLPAHCDAIDDEGRPFASAVQEMAVRERVRGKMRACPKIRRILLAFPLFFAILGGESSVAVTWAGEVLIEPTRCEVQYRAVPSEVKLGRFFSIEVSFKNQERCEGMVLQSYDLTMPLHKHGMNVKVNPVEKVESSNTFLLKSLKVHMPGQWSLKFIFKKGPSLLTREMSLPLI